MYALEIIKAVSVIVSIGSLSLFLFEWRHYQARATSKCKEQEPPDKGRLIRRSIGSLLLFITGLLMFNGHIPQAGKTSPQELVALFNYWLAILGTTFTIGIIALLDIISAIKKIRSTIALDNAREISLLAAQLQQAEKK